MVARSLTPPGKTVTAVIHFWNAMPNLAAVPKSAFDKERRHVIAALRSMTSSKIPDWEEARAKIFGAIKNYHEIRKALQNFEYVGYYTLSQFLKWQTEKFLDVNEPLRRLWKDKSRLPDKPSTDEEKVEMRARSKEHRNKWFAELMKRCENCKNAEEKHACPEESGMSAGLRDDGKYGCFIPREEK
jgi:hypothetical protein